MKKILIIEDDIDIADKLAFLASEVNGRVEVIKAPSKSKVIDLMSFHTFDAFFIDIQLEDYNGLELAKELRTIKKYQFVPMVFITAVPTRELEAYKRVHSYDYILKPFTREEIKRVFTDILLDYFDDRQEDESIILEYKAYNMTLLTKDILFIEIINRRVHIITQNDTIEYIIMPLKKFHERLPDQFIRVHQSFIINKDYVQSFSLSTCKIQLMNYDLDIPIGRSFVKELRGKL